MNAHFRIGTPVGALLLVVNAGLESSVPSVWGAPSPDVPSEFEIEHVTDGIEFPVAIAISPDGRAWVTEKQLGQIRVIKNGSLLTRPFADVHVNNSGERGGLGIALDPNFEANGFVYMFYTKSSTGGDTAVLDSVVDNRIVRFTASGDTAVAGSETLIRSFPLVSASAVHNGGNLHFAPDDTLVVTVGNGQFGSGPSLDLSNPRGKFHRIDPTTGDAAPGNVFSRDGDPATLASIYTYGHRNAFDFTFHPETGEIFSTENGPNEDDEINHIVEAGNYGWPEVVGEVSTPEESTYAADHADYREPLWISGSPTVCPTGIVVVSASSPWSQVLGECVLFGECKFPYRILKLPLGGTGESPEVGELDVFADEFEAPIIDLEIDTEDVLWVTTFPHVWRITLNTLVAVGNPGAGEFELSLAGSLPARGTVSLEARIPDGPLARLRLFDARGTLVRLLGSDWVGPGRFQAVWDGRDGRGVARGSGVYFAVLEQGGDRKALKFVYLE